MAGEVRQDLVINAQANVADANRNLAALDKAATDTAVATTSMGTAAASTSSQVASSADAMTKATSATDDLDTVTREAVTSTERFAEAQQDAARSTHKSATDSAQKVVGLREVMDDLKQSAVDAGNSIVSSLGSNAVKAMAATGIAMGGVGFAAFALKESAEKLFRSFGDEGTRVWDEAEKSLFGIQGAFAQAALGGGDLYEMGGKLKATFETLQEVLKVALVPFEGLFVIGSKVANLFTDLDERAARYTETMRQQAKVTGSARESYADTERLLAAANKEAQDLLATEEDRIDMRRREKAAFLESARAVMRESATAARAAEITREAIRQRGNFLGLQEETIQANRRLIETQAQAQAAAEMSADADRALIYMTREQQFEYTRLDEAIAEVMYGEEQATAATVRNTRARVDNTAQVDRATSVNDALAAAMSRVGKATDEGAEAMHRSGERLRSMIEAAEAANSKPIMTGTDPLKGSLQEGAQWFEAFNAQVADQLDQLSTQSMGALRGAALQTTEAIGEMFGAFVAGAPGAAQSMDDLGVTMGIAMAKQFSGVFAAIGAGLIALGDVGRGSALLGASATLALIAGIGTGARNGAAARGASRGARSSGGGAGSGGQAVPVSTGPSILVNLEGSTIISDDPRTTRGLMTRLAMAGSTGGSGV